MSAVDPRVLIGASQLGWVTALTQWVSEHGGARLIGHALTPVDVDYTAFDLLVLDGWSSLLSRRLVEETHGAGAAVLVLVNSERADAEASRLRDLGVSLSLPVSASPEEIVGRAREVAAVRRANGHSQSSKTEGGIPALPSQDNTLMVVLGDGAATEVSVNLAAATARVGRSTALVDLDTVNPKVAQRLALPLVPNVFTAVERLRSGRFDQQSSIGYLAGLTVVPGLANPRGWDELTSVDVDELIRGLRQRFSPTVVVVHPNLEDLAPLSGLQGRFDLARRTVEQADHVVVVANGSPTGAVRSLMLVADVRALSQAPVHVVVNRMPPDSFMRAEWTKELERSFTPASLTFLPFDRRVALAAWNGRLPDRGPFHREVRRLATRLIDEWAA
jgi:MinD-like ATPase involved in chromosome partitioning or flagellar assembly